MVDQQLETGVKGSRLRRRSTVVGIGAVGVAGVLGGLVAGAGMFASAATSGPTFSSDLAVCANPPAAVPGTPLFVSRFTVGGGKVSGTIPAPSATQLATLGITPTLVNVTVTTQYNSGRSGGNKTDVVTVNTPGHQFNNPLLFNIPPVVNSTVVGSGAVNYSAKTTGKAFATVTVSEFVVQATSTTPAVVNGTTCPTGETQVGSLQTNNVARPGTPTAVTATPGGAVPAAEVTGPNADAAPNNGAVTVTFTPPANSPAQVDSYEILPIDLTNPTLVQEPYLAVGSTNASSTNPLTRVLGGLNTNDTYQFQVFAVSNTDQVSVPTTPTAGVKPLVETTAATTASSDRTATKAKAATTK